MYKGLRDNLLNICANILDSQEYQLVNLALQEAKKLHEGQKRKSGEEYIVHPLNTALEIAKLNLGYECAAAALLHDVIEDCGVDYNYIEQKFGKVIADLVDGVTKISELSHNSNKRYTEDMQSLRKFLIASSKDVRVLIIKLSDRLHNMRTISALKVDKQVEYSDETLKVYVPLAEYIGLGVWKRELEDIAFKIKEYDKYNYIDSILKRNSKSYEKTIKSITTDLDSILKESGLKNYRVIGRVKSIHSIYGKLERLKEEEKIIEVKEENILQLKDLLGISIITEEGEIECYKILGTVHSFFEHVSEDFDDYIAKPKPNGYRALQTTVLFKGKKCEVQIKTEAMHSINEYGPASHIAYKLQGKRNASSTSQYYWIKNLNDWSDKKKRGGTFSLNLFGTSVFVITPKGKVMELERGSTVVDFAFKLHTDVGNQMTGAKVNSCIVTLDYELKNGDVIEIITSKSVKKPSLEWIDFAKGESTKKKIRKNVLELKKDMVITRGREGIRTYINNKLKIDWLLLDSSLMFDVMKEFGVEDVDKFYYMVGMKNIAKRDVLKLLVKKLNIKIGKASKRKRKKSVDSATPSAPITVDGLQKVDYKISGCCKPVYGDDIVGIVTLYDGLKIHRVVCENVKRIEKHRYLKAWWNKTK